MDDEIPAELTPRQVRFRCTDRGAHPSREIAVLTRFYTDVYTPSDALQAQQTRTARGRTQPVRAKAPLTSTGRGVTFSDQLFTFRCPTCHLTVQWKVDRAIRIVDDLIAARRAVIDLSALPANFK